MTETSPLEEMCCLCNKKDNILISTQETETDKNATFIDKLKYVFPDLMEMTKMDKYMSLICVLCKESLQEAYKFKEQCKNALTTRQAYFFPDLKEDGEQMEKSYKDEDDSDFGEHLYIEQDDIKEQPQENQETDNDTGKTYRTRSKKNEAKKNIVETLTYLADHNEKFFLCKRCNKQFANPRTLQAHMLRHTGLKKYVCNFCGKQNFTLSEHQSHMVLHKPDEPFTCNVCTKSFKEKARLTAHMKSHTKERKYMCDLCGKKFIYLSNLNCHKLMHSDARTYECKICKKAFKMHSTLKVHMDMHKNRTFQCEICKKMFQTYAGYYRHKIKHNVEPKFKCDVCDKSYYFKSVLNEHMRTHTQEKPFSCNVCKKEFGSKYVLKIHQLTHTGERPYKCSVCEKTFAQSGTLSVHMRLHTGVRPYKCKLCEKAFIKSHHYDNHMKKQHTTEYNEIKINNALLENEGDSIKCIIPVVIHESKYTPPKDPPKCNIVPVPSGNQMLC